MGGGVGIGLVVMVECDIDVRFLHVINYLHVSIIGSCPQGVAYFISVFTIFITLSVWV